MDLTSEIVRVALAASQRAAPEQTRKGMALSSMDWFAMLLVGEQQTSHSSAH